MTRFLKDTRFPAITQVEAYWEGLRAGRILPRRSEIDPRGIEGALEYAFILERIAPGIARMRIAGSHLTDLMGMEVRGMPASTFFTPTGRNSFSETLEAVFDSPAIATLDLTAERGIGKPAMEAKMLLLPLKSDLGDVSRVLGCLSTKGEIGRTPRRFDIQGTDMRPLIIGSTAPGKAPKSQTTLTETHLIETHLTKTPGERIPGLVDAQNRVAPKPSTTRPTKTQDPHNYLRLVTSND
ncbi:MAG: PAS domain-containing protein [Rhodobacterales bacterium]|nr:PAS domain-containing protein [Rhodobacterales bacterium]